MHEIIYPDLPVNVVIHPRWQGHTGFIYIAKYSKARKQINLEDHRWPILLNCQLSVWHCWSKWHPWLLQGTAFLWTVKKQEYRSGSCAVCLYHPQNWFSSSRHRHRLSCYMPEYATQILGLMLRITAVMVCHKACTIKGTVNWGKVKKTQNCPRATEASCKTKDKFCVVWTGLVCAVQPCVI